MSLFDDTQKKRSVMFLLVLAGVVVGEFLFLEGTMGISLPSDRGSAVSTVAVTVKGRGADHVVTENKRFTALEYIPGPGPARFGPVILRESFFADREFGAEGPPNATVTVEAIVDGKVQWSFQEPGQLGEALDENTYVVRKLGCCDAPSTYTYFSLNGGRKLRTTRVPLTTNELIAMESANR